MSGTTLSWAILFGTTSLVTSSLGMTLLGTTLLETTLLVKASLETHCLGWREQWDSLEGQNFTF